MSEPRPSVAAIMVAFRNDLDELSPLIDTLLELGPLLDTAMSCVVVFNDDQTMPEKDGVTVVSGHGNVGFAGGVGVGVDHAEADHVLIINPDCRVDPEHLAPLLRTSWARPRDIVIPLLVSPSGHIDYKSYENWVFTPGRKFAELVCKIFLLHRSGHVLPRFVKAPGTCMAMTTELARALDKPFDDTFFLYGEDRDLTNRVRRRGDRLYVERSASIIHDGGGSGSTVSTLVARARADAAYRIAFRRYGVWGVRLMRADLWFQALVKRLRGSTSSSAAQWASHRWSGVSEELPALNEITVNS